MTWKEFKNIIEKSGILDGDRLNFIITDNYPEAKNLRIEKIHDEFAIHEKRRKIADS